MSTSSRCCVEVVYSQVEELHCLLDGQTSFPRLRPRNFLVPKLVLATHITGRMSCAGIAEARYQDLVVHEPRVSTIQAIGIFLEMHLRPRGVRMRSNRAWVPGGLLCVCDRRVRLKAGPVHVRGPCACRMPPLDWQPRRHRKGRKAVSDCAMPMGVME